MQKQSPIIFSTPMVQSVHRELNPKTQTRRIQGLGTFNQNPKEWEFKRMVILPDGKLHACFIPTDSESVKGIFTTPFPYGLVGDILWVRETTKVKGWNHEENTMSIDYKASPDLESTSIEFTDDEKFIALTERLIKKLDKLGIEPIVDEENESFSYKWDAGTSPFDWTPAIHMPKEAARIWLEITDVKVERLQDITEQDAIAEGVFQYKKGAYQFYTKKPLKNITAGTESAKDSFYSLWTSINDTESWLHNPWVWVITFKQIAKPWHQ